MPTVARPVSPESESINQAQNNSHSPQVWSVAESLVRKYRGDGTADENDWERMQRGLSKVTQRKIQSVVRAEMLMEPGETRWT